MNKTLVAAGVALLFFLSFLHHSFNNIAVQPLDDLRSNLINKA